MRFFKSILFGVFLIGTTCIDEYNPEISESKSTELVIDGRVTDQAGNNFVRITRTFDLSQSLKTTDFISGATVKIIDNLGNEIMYTEETPGNYQAPPGFAGITGRSYKLEVTYNTKIYESTSEVLTSSPEIEDLKAEFKFETIPPGNTNAETNRIDFYLDIPNQEGTSRYYKYDWECTYAIQVPFWKTHASCGPYVENLNWEKIERCFVTEHAEGFVSLLSLEDYNGETFYHHYLTTIDPDIRFMLRYSMKVSQYSISKEAYQYWSYIKEQLINTGSLFGSPPHRIRGNISDSNNPNQTVLGYFTVSSMKTRREFFSPHVLQAEFLNFNNCDCYPNDCAPGGFPNIFCCICTFYPNASKDKPDFWFD